MAQLPDSKRVFQGVSNAVHAPNPRAARELLAAELLHPQHVFMCPTTWCMPHSNPDPVLKPSGGAQTAGSAAADSKGVFKGSATPFMRQALGRRASCGRLSCCTHSMCSCAGQPCACPMATLLRPPNPQAVRKLLAAELPDLRRVETRSLHRGVAGARHGFLEVPPGSNKLDMLRQARTRLQAPRAESL